mmetsp:Transcript_14210/g.20956  ORF Transcript_14210/g.20956 Transcript_14210/m.20956 type:complete len:118 (+) Transcript_14210:3361-3714(+)
MSEANTARARIRRDSGVGWKSMGGMAVGGVGDLDSLLSPPREGKEGSLDRMPSKESAMEMAVLDLREAWFVTGWLVKPYVPLASRRETHTFILLDTLRLGVVVVQPKYLPFSLINTA